MEPVAKRTRAASVRPSVHLNHGTNPQPDISLSVVPPMQSNAQARSSTRSTGRSLTKAHRNQPQDSGEDFDPKEGERRRRFSRQQAARRRQEASQQTERRRRSDALQHSSRKAFPTIGSLHQTALQSTQIGRHYLGAMSLTCDHCHAKHSPSRTKAPASNGFVRLLQFGSYQPQEIRKFSSLPEGTLSARRSEHS